MTIAAAYLFLAGFTVVLTLWDNWRKKPFNENRQYMALGAAILLYTTNPGPWWSLFVYFWVPMIVSMVLKFKIPTFPGFISVTWLMLGFSAIRVTAAWQFFLLYLSLALLLHYIWKYIYRMESEGTGAWAIAAAYTITTINLLL